MCYMTCIISDNLHSLCTQARGLIHNGLKSNTRNTYSSAQKQYMLFCHQHQLPPMPASEDQLLVYVAHLHRRGLSSSSVSVYLAAVRSLHICAGLADPLKNCPRLTLALKGFGIQAHGPKQKLPITSNILSQLRVFSETTYDTYMLWTAMNLGYFALLRASEFCVTNGFNHRVDLCLNDVSFIDESHMVVFIKCSKTDKFSNGIELHIGCSNDQVCAVCSMLRYLDSRRAHISSNPLLPLFIMSNGTPLSRTLLCKHIKLCMCMLGYCPEHYSGHSLRAGGATDAAKNGLSDWELKLLGRWSSHAYQRYIRLPIDFRLKFATRMIGHQPSD